jgi:CubicO group peptidase (beta-lactamase class C family)
LPADKAATLVNKHNMWYRKKSFVLPAYNLRGIIVVSLTCAAYRFATLITILAIGISSCNSSDQNKTNTSSKDSIALITLPEPLPVAKEEALRIAQACQRWYDSTLLLKGFNGGIIVAKNGTIVFEKYSGTGHLPGSDVINATTPFHIASVSKTFTAMAVLKLWQEGKLSIDDELSKYIPSFNYPGVTVRTLLNHRSGIPNYTYFMENLGWDKTKFVTNEDVLNYLITKKASIENIAPPNTKFSYCNTNYALLALLIEKISGKKYADYLLQNFFIPLQMKNSFVFALADSNRVIPSYDWKARLMPFNFLDAVHGDKNIYTTPQDLLLWDRALLSNKIFTPETLAQTYAPYSNEKAGTKNYGLGWRMNIYPTGKKIVYHNGWWHGNNAAFIRLLQDSATIIVLGNKFTRAIYDARALSNIFGEYFTPEDEEENETNKNTDSLSFTKNLLFPKPKTSKKNDKLRNFFEDKNKVNQKEK